MFCTKCGKKNLDDASFCAGCGTSLKANENMQHKDTEGSSLSRDNTVTSEGIPAGIKGWSWGAFFLHWIWAIGNRTWWGLLALIPYVGLIVAIWLGFKGREMAWRNRRWDSVDHFNRVQKRWSQWGVGLGGVFLIGILAAIAIPAYQGYVEKAKAKNRSSEIISSSNPASNSTFDPSTARPVKVTAAKDDDELWQARLRATANEVNKGLPITFDKVTRLDTSMAGPGRKFTYYYTLVTLSRTSIDDSRLAKFAETIKNRACTNKDMDEFFQNKTVVGFHYSDRDGNLVKQIEVHPTDCGYSAS
jgi:Tfp pilus assembly major pilin PilA